MACHLRSASVPSSPLSDGTDVQDRLRSLKAAMSLPSVTIQIVCGALTELVSIYSCIDELTCSTSSSQTQQRKSLEDELERSLMLLDLCSSMQEIFAELRTSVQEVQLSLKRVDGTAVHTKVQSYARLSRKAQRLCKRISSMVASDMEGCSAIKMTAEARDIAIVILKSTLHLFLKQITIPKFSSSWSLVSKAFQKKRFA
ncbi:hypothetical protein CFC21_109177 [Triticum aestivum]|uniref:Uncharacterized protein n=2 Tax=Triticum aestivum TaxID=4565 RepID=A0A9R1MKJ8_WHEAT|nr:uncharacterized protein LOC123170197 [Triticum aestivum]KAF7108771.1 hypothetical protein CFC21_109177 [Triticum aestivum]